MSDRFATLRNPGPDRVRDRLGAIVRSLSVMEFLAAEWIGKPVWMWAGFFSVVVALLAFDLGVLHKEDKEMGISESLWLSAFYIGFAILYGGAIWWAYEAGQITTSTARMPA
jgi:hypothetical protein